MNCPLCGELGVEAFQVHGIPIRNCQHCHHRYADFSAKPSHVATHYGDAYFEQGGVGYPDYLADEKILKAHGRRYAHILSRFTPPGSVLDIGSAAGFILDGFVKQGWAAWGVEPNPKMARYAKETFPVEILNSAVEDAICTGTLDSVRPPQGFDLVTWIQVLPHFVDPLFVSKELAVRTKPGGYWLIETWDRQSWKARLAGKAWHEYSPPSVLHWFSRKSLLKLTKNFGFEEVAHGRPSKQISMRHVQSLFQARKQEHVFAALGYAIAKAFPANLTIPYPPFDLFWTLLQKSPA